MGEALTKKQGRGRPSAFNEKVALRILELAKAGQTEAQIAKAIGVSTTTFSNWKSERPDFLDALKECKSVADELVEATLFQRALGYKAPAIKIFCTKGGEIVTHRYIEQYAPDTTACIFWLKNRKPDEWRDVHRHEIEGTLKLELPTPKEAVKILEADFALLPAPEVKVEDL